MDGRSTGLNRFGTELKRGLSIARVQLVQNVVSIEFVLKFAQAGPYQ
jgi:hypothetical protein